MRSFCQALGLHPLVGFGMFAVDWMLFSAEAASLGATWAVSVPIAALLAITAVFIQRFSFKDSWGSAIGKSLLVGLLTAIPTALPSIITVGGGAVGAAKMLLPKGERNESVVGQS